MVRSSITNPNTHVLFQPDDVCAFGDPSIALSPPSSAQSAFSSGTSIRPDGLRV